MKDPNSRPIEVSKPFGSNQICAVCWSPSANKKVANLSKTPWKLNIPRGKLNTRLWICFSIQQKRMISE